MTGEGKKEQTKWQLWMEVIRESDWFWDKILAVLLGWVPVLFVED